MKFGLWFTNIGPWATPEGASQLIRAAESSGFESLWTVDHPVFIGEYDSKYPYSPSGRIMIPLDTPVVESFPFLGWVAGQTSTLKLGTGVLVLPHRNPVITAKLAASLDAISGGRLLLGVGIGWLREEFDAIGVDFDDRAVRFEEGIATMRALWNQPVAEYDGRYNSFKGAYSYPKPANPGGIPVLIGGSSLVAARRAGRIGDGWFGVAGGTVPLEQLIAELRAAAETEGRDPDSIEISWGVAPSDDGTMALSRDDVRRYAEMGVHRLIVSPPSLEPDRIVEATEEFAAAYLR